MRDFKIFNGPHLPLEASLKLHAQIAGMEEFKVFRIGLFLTAAKLQVICFTKRSINRREEIKVSRRTSCLWMTSFQRLGGV